jgi:hypothetical protein
MYHRTEVQCQGSLEYLNAHLLLANWWSQGSKVQTLRPDPATLAMLTDGRVIEMAVRS